MPKALKLRTDCISPEVDERVVAFIRTTFPSHLVVAHSGDAERDGDHWHAILWTDRPAQSVRVHLLQRIPELKRRYSLGTVGGRQEDAEAYERYMCHGACEGDAVRIVSAQAAVHHPEGAYTQAWAQEQNRRFYHVQRAFVREQRAAKESVMDVILRECTERGATDVRPVADTIAEVYTSQRRMMNTVNMRSQLRTALCVMNGRRAQRAVVDEILQGLVAFPESFRTSSTHTYMRDEHASSSSTYPEQRDRAESPPSPNTRESSDLDGGSPVH